MNVWPVEVRREKMMKRRGVITRDGLESNFAESDERLMGDDETEV